MRQSGVRPFPLQSEARRLLVKAIETGGFSPERLARELVVSERTLAQYAAGEVMIPAERQLCLAHFLVDNVPALAREGRNLVGKAQAQIRFRSTDTVTHQTMPVSSARST
jgi:hypothetical protein